MKAIINATEEGTFLKPLTSTKPTSMLTVCCQQIIGIIAEQLCSCGFDEICIQINNRCEEIKNFVSSKNYPAKIHFMPTQKNLCGIKNAFPKCDEPILYINGNCICDFNFKSIYSYHLANKSMVTVVTVENKETDYGVVCSKSDGQIKCFIENPSQSQGEGNGANTGIYVINPLCFDFFPENTDFSFIHDVFPAMIHDGIKITEYCGRGYWQAVSDIGKYRKLQWDILDGKVNLKLPDVYKSIVVKDQCNVRILPPAYIGKNVRLGENTVVGPYCVIGDNTVVGDNVKIHNSIIGNENQIDGGAKLNGVVMGDNCRINKNVTAYENTMIGDGVTVLKDAVIKQNVRIWPNKQIKSKTVVTENVKYSFNCEEYISPDLCCRFGSALGSSALGKRVGIAFDGKSLSRAMLMCIAGGLLAMGSRVWTFYDALLPQLYFYTAYCSLDSGIYVSSKNNAVTIKAFRKGGMPLNSGEERELRKRIENKGFLPCNGRHCKSLSDMSGVGLMYERELLNQCQEDLKTVKAKFICQNDKVRLLLEDAFKYSGGSSGDDYIFSLSENGEDVTLSDKYGNEFSKEQMLAVCCMIEFMYGNSVAVPYKAPQVIDYTAKKYKCFVYRYGKENIYDEKMIKLAFKQGFVRDSLFLCMKVLNAVKITGMNFSDLIKSLPDYKKTEQTINIDYPVYDLYKILSEGDSPVEMNEWGAQVRRNNANALILPIDKGKRIRIISEASMAETADSFMDQIVERLGCLMADEEGEALTKG